ncbi:ATP-binding protein [Candidatus Pacearchaeota archaeon]|nr:ATP-binding protein [Candidatus Pacearchaeota archaeon]
MAKQTFALEDRVVEYDENSITCKSKRFQELFPVPYMKLAENMTRMQIDASEAGTEKLSARFDEVEKKLGEYGFSKSEAIDYSICLSEAVLNAQRHSLKLEEGKKFSLEFYIADKLVLMTISSVGEPYNIKKSVECIKNMQIDLYRECGRGNAIMISMCDFFHVLADGNETEVTLGKIAS